ncbi:bifunctional adenosylcobinamide kinase/adenosylcobinamide-phosphate guanylyltransferase [Litchfieldia salsa]|uniref:Adenosylcobinamide kinase /adenosylcobinamide-phosphate guanylyltransferase n=1 Tax=Litchfieldia salsa TaxID=930152 RepID=A0A1H0URX2_9BACI|nr:bifunctional adenosylcobinamide kinase/adenosylcobinamide-phosphate guanylyltransferase [Litchfieldia salsa]SDP68718.1 adenosylcobinamide kinase /adenosylcobinamide-phosphate guanylyltransferase [Litchfieldia salsa]
MQLVIGGAFSGKRKWVRETYGNCSWISAYNGDRIEDWETKWEKNTTLVLEGWEQWISSELEKGDTINEIRNEINVFFLRLLEEERNRNSQITLIMLEIGKGIVPLQKDERSLRDLSGWIAQDAASLSTEVYYMWNGLSKRMK